MKKYKVVKLNEPDGRITHKLELESMTKHGKDSGGYNYSVLFKGTWKECHQKKKEYIGG